MSFIEDNLSSDEHLVYQANVSWFVYLNSLIWFSLAVAVYIIGRFELSISSPAVFIASLFVGLIGLMKFSDAFMQQTCTEIGITNKRMIAKFGFVARTTLEIPLNRIESVSIDQSVIERITCCGTVAVHGTGQTMSPVRYIDSPVEFRNELNEAIASNKAASATN